MNFRRNAAKPSVALWMLVAIGDLVLLAVNFGIAAVIALVSIVAVAVAGVRALSPVRREASRRESVPAPARVPVRPARMPVDSRRRA
ncbi:MAG TPA: hypothetical protein VGD43_13845 [Micromonospora sp.]